MRPRGARSAICPYVLGTLRNSLSRRRRGDMCEGAAPGRPTPLHRTTLSAFGFSREDGQAASTVFALRESKNTRFTHCSNVWRTIMPAYNTMQGGRLSDAYVQRSRSRIWRSGRHGFAFGRLRSSTFIRTERTSALIRWLAIPYRCRRRMRCDTTTV